MLWHRAGVAFVNQDESLKLTLVLFPDLKLQVSKQKDKSRQEAVMLNFARIKEIERTEVLARYKTAYGSNATMQFAGVRL